MYLIFFVDGEIDGGGLMLRILVFHILNLNTRILIFRMNERMNLCLLT